jgi:prevent-host-death family protein
MGTVDIHEAKTHLSKLIERVTEGEEIIIARGGKPVARLAPIAAQPKKPRVPGRLRGKIWVGKDFDAPLPQDVLALFEGPGAAPKPKRTRRR